MNPTPATHDLLLYCLREEPDASRLEQLTESNWHDLIRQARSHAVLYLLYHRLKNRNLDSYIPPDILQTVRTEYFECAWRNNNLYNDLSKILKALQQENIPVILLKGAHLAQVVYSKIALRPMGDIDILVKKNDLPKAKDLLLKLGYTPIKEVDIATACAYSQHISPMIKQNAPPVELHWTLEVPTSPFTIDLKGLWQRAQPTSVGGVEALTLSPDDLLLHLCLHTSAHHLYSNGLRALCDIRESIRQYRDEINWEEFMLRTRQWGAGNAVYLTLHFAESLLGADVPDDFLDTHRPESFTPETVAEFKRILFRQGAESLPIVKLYRSISVTEKTRFFLRRIFLSPEELGERYLVQSDSPLIILYYFIRLKDVLVKYSRTVWRIWRREKATTQQVQLIDWLLR